MNFDTVTKIPAPLNFIIGRTTKKEAFIFFQKQKYPVSGIHTISVNGFDKISIDKSVLTMESFQFDSAVLYFDKKNILRKVNFYFKDFLIPSLKDKAIEIITMLLSASNHQLPASNSWKTNNASIKLSDIGLSYTDDTWFSLLDEHQEETI